MLFSHRHPRSRSAYVFLLFPPLSSWPPCLLGVADHYVVDPVGALAAAFFADLFVGASLDGLALAWFSLPSDVCLAEEADIYHKIPASSKVPPESDTTMSPHEPAL